MCGWFNRKATLERLQLPHFALMKWMFPSAALLLAGCTPPTIPAPPQTPPPVPVGTVPSMAPASEKPASMDEAVARARRELPVFKRYLALPPSRNRFVQLKAKFSQNGATEQMWIGDPTWNAAKQTFSGALSNTPSVLKNLKIGQEVTVAERDVVDWVVEFAPTEQGENPRALGGYTVRSMMNKGDKARGAQGTSAR